MEALESAIKHEITEVSREPTSKPVEEKEVKKSWFSFGAVKKAVGGVAKDIGIPGMSTNQAERRAKATSKKKHKQSLQYKIEKLNKAFHDMADKPDLDKDAGCYIQQLDNTKLI